MGFARPLMWNVAPAAELIFYLLIPVVLLLVLWGIVWRIRKWTIGRPEPGVGRLGSYLVRLVRQGRLAEWIRTALFQSRLSRDPFALGMHLAIFWGMVVLFLGTAIATIDQDIAHLIFGTQILRGVVYQLFELVLDIFGVILLIGLGMAGYRRLVLRPDRLANPSRPVSFWDNFPFLQLLALIAITGFLVEGIRLAQGFQIESLARQQKGLCQGQADWEKQWAVLGGRHLHSEHRESEVQRIAQGGPVFPAAPWAPVGWLLGKIFQHGSLHGLELWHQVLWWLHALLAFGFLVAIAWTRAFHIISSPLNLLLKASRPVGRLPVAAPSGVARLRDFTWQQLMQFDSCTWCGRCQEVCPGHQCNYPLSPKEVVLALDGLLLRTPTRLAKLVGNSDPASDAPSLAQSGGGGGSASSSVVAESVVIPSKRLPALHGEAISAEVLWSCCTCRACEEICPVQIEQPRAIIDMRRHLVDVGQVDENLQQALINLQRYGNSFGQSPRKRTEGLQKAGLPIKDARKEEVEFLWFLGDYAAYDPRVLEGTQAAARLFALAGVSVGFLMDKEQNSGNDVRRVGEEGLYEMLRDKNLQALKAARFQAIVTTDPHSYNTLRNEYVPYPENGGNGNVPGMATPAAGGRTLAESAATREDSGEGHPLAGKPIFHVVELLDRWIGQGRLPIRRRLDVTVTYHDPCYLGRYNGIYDPPRRILKALGVRLLEMPRNRDNSFCCGAGGGRIWMKDLPGIQVRPAEKRIHEALELPGVQVLVVACPKDLVMFLDAAKTTGAENRLRVVDICQLVLQAVSPEETGPPQ